MKKAIAAILVAAASIPLGGAQAGHCNDIFVFSRYVTEVENPTSGNPLQTPTYAMGQAGCTVPQAHADTEFLIPGTNAFSVRTVRQIDGLYVLPTRGTATLSWGGTIQLSFTGGGSGTPADSPNIFYNPSDHSDTSASVDPDATIAVQVCWGTLCQSRTFRTMVP